VWRRCSRQEVLELDDKIALREEVRARYAASASSVTERSERACDCGEGAACCDPSHGFGGALYDALHREELPEAAVLASLGCGNPIAVADLHEGERVLDLGSGGGIDVLLSARRVGPAGKVYGLDMTEERLALAMRNAAEAGATNVEFLRGYIEDVPLPAGTIDVVISNCVINLSTDKSSVFAEIARVLRDGGRIGISDVVADDHLSPEQRAERGSYVGCIAGALSFAEYEEGLRLVGFDEISITSTNDLMSGMHSAIIKAVKRGSAPLREKSALPLRATTACC
jgi:arsenite methyltransferase